MAQVTDRIDHREFHLVEQFDYDEDISVGSAFSKILAFSAVGLRDHIFHFRNTDTSTAVTYKIFGTAQRTVDLDDADPETDDAWINLTSPATYDHTATVTIPANDRGRRALSDVWRYIIVMASATSAVEDFKAYHRGQS